MEEYYQPPMVEDIKVNVENGYAGSQLPERNPIQW